MLVEARRYYKDNDDRGYRREARDIYAHLRMCWERGVEELLFNGVVRFVLSITDVRYRSKPCKNVSQATCQ
jgi:hypothetical protein